MSLCETRIRVNVTRTKSAVRPCNRAARRYKITAAGFTIESSLCESHKLEAAKKNPAARFEDLGA